MNPQSWDGSGITWNVTHRLTPQEKLYSLEGNCWAPWKHTVAYMKGRHVRLPALAEPGRGRGGGPRDLVKEGGPPPGHLGPFNISRRVPGGTQGWR